MLYPPLASLPLKSSRAQCCLQSIAPCALGPVEAGDHGRLVSLPSQMRVTVARPSTPTLAASSPEGVITGVRILVTDKPNSCSSGLV